MFTRVVLTLVGLVVCGIPTELYLLAKWAFEPNGFWQEIVLVGLGLSLMGFLQFCLVIAFVAWLVFVWED